MSNVRCDLKNIRPRSIRGFLENNKVIHTDTEVGLPIPYIIKAMNLADVYVNGKHIETYQEAASIFDNIKVEVTTPADIIDKLSSINEGDIIELSSGDYNEVINIAKPCIIKGTNGTKIHNTLNITAPNVVLDGVKFVSNGKALSIDNTGDVSMVGCTFESDGTEIRTPINITSSGQVVIDGCTFDSGENKFYNCIEFGINGKAPLKDNTIIRNCKFIGKIKNNHISIYDIEDGAKIYIENCYFEYSNNAIRISNPLNSSATFIIKDCKYDYVRTNKYSGLLMFQDYSKAGNIQDFTKIHINFTNLIGPDGKVMKDSILSGDSRQVYYVYDDQDGIISDKNQPIVTFT